MLISLLLCAVATADPVLAIPAEPAPAPLTAEGAESIRIYRSDHLHIRPVAEVLQAAYTTWYEPGWGWTTEMSVQRPRVWGPDSWLVYQGRQGLTVPSYLERVGDQTAASALQDRIRKSRRAATAWYVLAGAGGAASLVGVFGMDGANNRKQYLTWSAVSTSGIAVGVVGLIAGSGPSSRARRYELDPSMTLDQSTEEVRIRTHNEALRTELELTPAQALEVEKHP
jgi:hypothetical protein